MASAPAACSSDILALMPATALVRSGPSIPKFTRLSARRATSASPVTSSPPSPTAKGLVTWKEKTWVAPSDPTRRRCSSRAPNAAAESTTSGTPAASQVARHASRVPAGGAVPKVEVAITPATRPPCSASTRASSDGSSCHAAVSTSMNRGTKPAHAIAHAVAVNVNEGTMTCRRLATGSPKAARRATMSPTVQLARGMQDTSVSR